MYSCANKEENLENLLILINNQSKIKFNQNEYLYEMEENNILNKGKKLKPMTLGDLVLIQIKNLIDKKIKVFNFENSNISFSFTKDGSYLEKNVELDISGNFIKERENDEKDVPILKK